MKRMILWISLLSVLAVAAGCAATSEQNGSLPWSAPASWENQTIGVPL